jgi:hypothetical protein
MGPKLGLFALRKKHRLRVSENKVLRGILGTKRDEVHVRRVPCHHGMARPQVANGGVSLQFWRVAAYILNKQSRAADTGWSSSLGGWAWG